MSHSTSSLVGLRPSRPTLWDVPVVESVDGVWQGEEGHQVRQNHGYRVLEGRGAVALLKGRTKSMSQGNGRGVLARVECYG